VHQLQVGGKHYLLLPKLNSQQVEILARRFSEIGTVQTNVALVVKSREGTIMVSEEGLCWSSFDPSDVVLPAVPALLSCPKEEASVETIKRKYFRASRSKEGTTFHVLPRLESSSLWRKLRALDQCALAPDEHAVVTFLLKRIRGDCEMITDFPVEGSTPLVIGRKRYFDSKINPEMAVSTLRVVEERGQRNSYLRRDGRIGPSPVSAPGRHDWLGLFSDLGEWCPFNPV